MKPGITPDDMFAVASMFTDRPGARRGEVYARTGEMAASDGRMLVRIKSPIITEIPCKNARDAEAFFQFVPEAETRLAGREWIEGALFPAVEKQMALEGARLEKVRSENQAERWHVSFARCPCCNAEIVIDNGDIVERDVWERDIEPDPRCDGGMMALTGNRVTNGSMIFRVFYLDRMRRAGTILGDVEGLYCGSFHLVLRGAGWFVVLASMRHEQDASPDEKIAVPEGGAE